MSSISLPFRFNDFGQVEATFSESKYWKDQVLLTLMTRVGERVMRPDFGSTIGSTLFESTTVAADTAVSTLTSTFNRLLPKLRLMDLVVTVDEDTNSVEVTVYYVLPSGNTDTATINTAIFNRYGDVLEEIPRG